MNTTEDMIRLYQERLDGFDHEEWLGLPGEWVEVPKQKGFNVGHEYRKIEKPQTLEEGLNSAWDVDRCGIHFSHYATAWNACAAWILRTGWKGDE